MSEQVKQGHPRALYTAFATEMWERFSYYGMRSLLTLYLTAELASGGFGLDRTAALEIYAIFTGLVYLTPILGGWIADSLLGKRKTVYIGGLVMAVGQFLLAASAFMSSTLDPASRLFLFNFGLGTLIIGNGLFKPNISTIVGEFYEDNDPRKDSAFNIFYMGINLGAILGPFIAGALGENVHWGWGYFSAGVGLIISVIWMKTQESNFERFGLPPESPTNKFILDKKDWMDIYKYTIALIVGTLGIMLLWGLIPNDITSVLVIIGFIILLGGLALIIFRGTESKQEWSRMMVIVVLAFFNIVFWAGFEQAGGTMNLFAMENTDRLLGSWEIPATWFQNINPMAILIFAPIFSILWLKLDAKKLNPRTPIKFALGMFLGAIAFYIMSQASNLADGGGLISPLWLVVVYVILTLGELMLSPIGLSMITKLAPPKLVSVVMGLWMASFAAGNYFAGIMESILHKFDLPLYPFIAGIMFATGVILVLLSPLLNKAMRGIH